MTVAVLGCNRWRSRPTSLTIFTVRLTTKSGTSCERGVTCSPNLRACRPSFAAGSTNIFWGAHVGQEVPVLVYGLFMCKPIEQAHLIILDINSYMLFADYTFEYHALDWDFLT